MKHIISQAREFTNFSVHILRSRKIIYSLARNDFQKRFMGSYLGLAWSVIHPLATISVLYLVFGIVFQRPEQAGIPFVLWLVAGIIPWLFFTEAWSGATASISQYNYLVKKMVFRVSMLPLVKLLSVLPIHFLLLCIALTLFLVRGHAPDWHLLQLPYYTAALLFLLMGLCWLTSSLFIFLKDIGQMITVVIQFGFWATPIVWSPEMLPAKIRFIAFINPLNYIISGYRDSFTGSYWFWEKPMEMVYFWIFATTFFILGALVFARLRPHFADVL